jgi:hypothetical protein
MLKLLDNIGVPAQILPNEDAERTISDAVTIMAETNKPAAIIVRRGVIE